MTPIRFLWIAGISLIVLGVLGISGILGSISDLGFFHPPHWINWAHFSIGVFALIVTFSHSKTFQNLFVLTSAVSAMFVVIFDLLLNSFAVGYLIIGLFGFWAWRNRNK